MNIALFASAFHPSLGGVEELCRQLALELMRQGHGVIVLANRWPRDLPASECINGVSVYRFPQRVPEGTAAHKLAFYLTHRLIARRMLSVLRHHEVDLLHVQCVSSNAHYAMIAQEKLRLPLVVTLHGELTMDASQLFTRSAHARALLRRSLDRADVITACSGDALADAEKFYSRSLGTRARAILNGVDLEEFSGIAPYKHPRPYIFALGRFVREKGFDVLLRAYAAQRGRSVGAFPDLIIAGDGPEMAAWAQLVVELGIRESVDLPGRLGRREVASYMAGCEFFVLPSRQEPLGIVNLEAMASGKAVLGSRVGGVPEVVLDGETGLLVEGESVDSLAAGLQVLVGDIAMRNRMGDAGRKRAAEFAWPAVAKKYLDVYEAAIAMGKDQ